MCSSREANIATISSTTTTLSKVTKTALTPPPFFLSLQVLLLLLAGLGTRLSGLDQPRNVVFDEMHYGKYASLYLRGTFFFDSNPPLGKMMAAGAAW